MLVPPFIKAHRIACIAATACVVAPVPARAAGEPANPAGPLPLAYVAHAAGPAAQPVFVLGWALLALCVFVCVTIAVLLIAMFRRRTHAGGAQGNGVPDHGPPLAGNSAVLAADPTSAIRIVVEGARPAPGTHGPVQRMPAMRGALTSSEIAAVVSYVRGAWGNRAAPVSEQDVRQLRAAIHR